LAQEHGDTGRLARTLRLLTLVAAGEGDFDHSRALALESAEAARASGDHWALVMALNNLGLAALESHQPSQARSLLEEAASLADANEDERSRAFVLENLAFARLMDGDRLGARTDFVESLVLANELEFAEVIAMDLTGLAAVEAAGQRFVLAARVLGRADRLLEETGTYQDAIESEVRAQTLRALEAALGVDALAYELQAGRAFSLDEVVALALASID